MTDERKALDVIARALHPHWPEGHRGTYSPEQLASKVEQQAERIAELEARVSAAMNQLADAVTAGLKASGKANRLEAERDAVRKALVKIAESWGQYQRNDLSQAEFEGTVAERVESLEEWMSEFVATRTAELRKP